MGQPQPLFLFLFSSFHTESFSSQEDTNSDRQSRRQERWPPHHHNCPHDKCFFSVSSLTSVERLSWATAASSAPAVGSPPERSFRRTASSSGRGTSEGWCLTDPRLKICRSTSWPRCCPTITTSRNRAKADPTSFFKICLWWSSVVFFRLIQCCFFFKDAP